MIYNKLVRDNIPHIMESDPALKGLKINTKTLDNQEYETELKKKLIEESMEVVAANEGHLKEELADIYEIMTTLMRIKGISMDDLKQTAHEKRMDRGGFDTKTFLISVDVE